MTRYTCTNGTEVVTNEWNLPNNGGSWNVPYNDDYIYFYYTSPTFYVQIKGVHKEGTPTGQDIAATTKNWNYNLSSYLDVYFVS